MYSLMIAEDEEIERKALSLFIGNNFTDIQIIEGAVNGIQLVEKAIEFCPDIIIVDINMPGLNGLDAIKMLREKGLRSKILIQTAYSQFQYAQDAIPLEVENYLLKPFKHEKIVAAIKGCIEKIEKEQEEKSKRREMEIKLHEIAPLMKSDLMLSIILGENNTDSLRVYLNILGLKFSSGYVMSMIIPNYGDTADIGNEIEKNKMCKNICNFITDELMNICTCIVSPIINGKVSACILMENEMNSYKFKLWVTEIAQFVEKKVENTFHLNLKIGIGQLYTGIEQMTMSYKESVSALLDKTTNINIKYFADLFNISNQINPFTPYEGEIIKQIEACNLQESKEIINKIFSQAEQVDSNNMLDMALGFIVVINRSLMGNNFSQNIISLKTAYSELSELNSKEKLKAWLAKEVEFLICHIKRERESKISSLVLNGIEYINNNYSRDISLENIAEALGVSPYYISRLFKQELKKNFVDYLTDVRIKHALNLLRGKDCSIKELSEKVGYNNPTYFCKVFKRKTGKTIGEYKNSM